MLKFIFILSVFSVGIFAREPMLIGIAGGTGSGKTTLAEKIYEAFPEAVLISQDAYYRDQSHLSLEQRSKLNFDHPDSLDFSLLRDHLIDLKNGKAIAQPVYSFQTHSRGLEVTQIEPADIILVEGILLFAAPEVRDLFDLKIFVDTDDDVRVLRRADRDMKERGRDFEGVKEQYLATVKPMHSAFVAPSKRYADVILPGEGNTQVGLDLILSQLKARADL